MEMLGNTFSFDWEISLMAWIQTHLGPFGVNLAAVFTQFGEPLTLVLILGLFYWGFDKKYGKYMAVNILSVGLLGPMIKNTVLRRRPYFDHEAIQCLRPVEGGDIYDISRQGFSFPSLHAANSVNMFTVTGRYVKNKPLKILCFIIPFLVGVSRFVLGVHYPTDVLIGWAFGLAVMFLMDLLLEKLPNINWIFAGILIIGIPGFFFCKSTDFYTSYGLALGTVCAFLFEERRVNFAPAKNSLFALIRVILGAGIFLAVSSLLKLPFPKEFLEIASTASFLVRTTRYAITSFIIIGVYPLSFNKGRIDL